VQDSGPGIAARDLQRLFQPFTQLDSTLARQFEGTGLGLALVKRLAVQHGGSVDVTSSGIAGEGSCFTVTLPYTPISPEVQDNSASYMPARGFVPLPKRGDGPRVLLVEDNEVSIEALGGYLEYLGYRMLIARTGPEAIASAQAEPPDLVLMDIQLPLMDGFEVTRQLRCDPRFAATPIIALTALAMPNDRARCLEAGATEYMSKPIRPRDLATLMERLLST
jgi:CheY-like chemotaxis protein